MKTPWCWVNVVQGLPLQFHPSWWPPFSLDAICTNYQEYKYELRIAFLKKHVKFERIVKSSLFKVCSIAFIHFSHLSGTSVKIFSFCCEPFIEPFFTSPYEQSAAQQVRDLSVQTSGNWKEPSLVSNPHGVELPNWMLPTCHEPVLSYVVESCHEEKWLCVTSVSILAFFQVGNGSNRWIVIGNVNINRFRKY